VHARLEAGREDVARVVPACRRPAPPRAAPPGPPCCIAAGARRRVGFGPNPVMLSRGSMVASMPLCH